MVTDEATGTGVEGGFRSTKTGWSRRVILAKVGGPLETVALFTVETVAGGAVGEDKICVTHGVCTELLHTGCITYGNSATREFLNKICEKVTRT